MGSLLDLSSVYRYRSEVQEYVQQQVLLWSMRRIPWDEDREGKYNNGSSLMGPETLQHV